MNDAMHLVAKGWYRLYFGMMLAFSVAIAAGCVLTMVSPSLEHYAETFGLSPAACIFAGLHIVYSLTLYWWLRKRSQPLAAIVGSMFLTLVLLGCLSATDPSSAAWIYVGMWFATLLLVGMFGLPFALGSIMVAGLYVLLHNDFELMDISAQSWALLIGTAIIAPLSYLFWRKRFINEQEAQLHQLSGMLRQGEEQSTILIESIADGVIVINTEGKVKLMNPAAAKMTEWPLSEASGIDVQTVVKLAKENGEPIDPNSNPFAIVINRKEHVTQTLQLTGRRGLKIVISLVISPVIVPDGGMAGAVAVIRDISDERAAEQQRGEFISTASHEMRTPVAAIEGYLALALNDKVSTIDTRARGYLEKAHASTQHLGKLFQDLLTSAKAEDGRLSSHPQIVEMGSYLEQLVEDMRFSAQKKNLLAEFVIGDTGGTIDATKDDKNSLKVVKPLYYVYADPERLREVITNLFDNAIKYTDQGKISIGLTGDTDVVQIYIKDTGAGIPKEDIGHLFQKFYRVDNSATRVIGGTGLGLFISRKIVELYKGRIWVESELGKGSTFFINLPRIPTQKASQMQAADASTQVTPTTPLNTSTK